MKTMTFDVKKIVRVIDGDSVRVMLDHGCDLYSIRDVRLRGVDTPEITGELKEFGREIAHQVERWLLRGKTLRLISWEWDKYGRLIGDIAAAEHPDTLVVYLLNSGLAREYAGDKRQPWTTEQLARIREALKNS